MSEYIYLTPVKETLSEWDELEAIILKAFRKKLFNPLIRILGVNSRRITNSKAKSLKDAVAEGTVSYGLGIFKGLFTATVSKELRALGATWDVKAQGWRLPASEIPKEVIEVLRVSTGRWHKTLSKIDDQIRQVLPAEIAGAVDSKKIFAQSLWKVDKKVDNTLKSIAILPNLTEDRRDRIATEWQENLDKWITDFAEENIPKLRAEIQKHVFSGGRHADLVKVLEKSYGVTQRKAKFLAGQETRLLMSKFKEVRYQEAGIDEYEWGCVAGSKNHPVRPSHLALKGKVFRFDDPPVTTAPGEPERKNNPGEDYNCRCFARPRIRKKTNS